MRDIDFSDLAKVQISHMVERSRREYGEQQTKRYGAALRKTFDRIALFPESGDRVRGSLWTVPGITHAVVYTFDHSLVKIEAFVENGRDIRKLVAKARNRQELVRALLREHGPAGGRDSSSPARATGTEREPGE